MTVRIIDTTLRDGSHLVHHRYQPEQVQRICQLLDAAGVWAIDVGHGDGLGGASLMYGLPAFPDEVLIRTAAQTVSRAKIAVVLAPGIGTKRDIEVAAREGASLLRIGLICTEADVGLQHVRLARELGMEVHCSLAMANIASPERIAESGRMVADAGCHAVYVADSAGALMPDQIRNRVTALRSVLPEEVAVGVHAHNNLSLAVANSLAAIQEGATVADVTLAGMGPGGGNCQAEALVAVCERSGISTGVDLFTVQDAADNYLRPEVLPAPMEVDGLTAMLGYAGLAATFLPATMRAADRFGVDPRKILLELGERRTVIGQEDMIIDVAAALSQAKEISTIA